MAINKYMLVIRSYSKKEEKNSYLNIIRKNISVQDLVISATKEK